MTEQEKLSAPAEGQVLKILSSRLPGVKEVRRVPQGVSTYVYRVSHGGGVCYARFLPEDATFGVEVLAQRLLTELGVPVPQVLLYEPREPVIGLSLMAAAELPGESLTEDTPLERMAPVLREAGAALRRLHTLPVEGFGWIVRESESSLKGEHPDFPTYFTEFLEEDLAALLCCGADTETVKTVRRLMEEALELLNIPRAALVHGDFCLDHIFHKGGAFTGFIDFGEIRGNHPFFDLGVFALNDPTPNRAATALLLEGYGGLTAKDLRAIDLTALAFALRFVGRKVGSPAERFWVERLLSQLKRV